jgi:Glycosyltransferase involved in LPS biosynthesis
MEDFFIPVYIINIKERLDRKAHIEEQFVNKPEFETIIVEAEKNTIGAVGLWNSIVKVVNMAIDRDDEVIIICEDDHTFTKYYNKQFLFYNISLAGMRGMDLLSGGVSGFGTAIPIGINSYTVDWFWGTQFIVLFKHFFNEILNYEFKETDTADGVLSKIAKKRTIIYPFISCKKILGIQM